MKIIGLNYVTCGIFFTLDSFLPDMYSIAR